LKFIYLKSAIFIFLVSLLWLTRVYSEDNSWIQAEDVEINVDSINDSIAKDTNRTYDIRNLGLSLYGSIVSGKNGFGLSAETGNLNIRNTFYKTGLTGRENNSYGSYYRDSKNIDSSYVLVGPSIRVKNILGDRTTINMELLLGVSEDENVKDMTVTKINFIYKVRYRLYIGIDGYFLYINSKESIVFLNEEKFIDNTLRYKTTIKTIYKF
jgi:hypothetical protein